MENRWSKSDWASIVIVSGQEEQKDPRNPPSSRFGGNGFIVQANDQYTWVVTCAHVIDELQQRKPLVILVDERSGVLMPSPQRLDERICSRGIWVRTMRLGRFG